VVHPDECLTLPSICNLTPRPLLPSLNHPHTRSRFFLAFSPSQTNLLTLFERDREDSSNWPARSDPFTSFTSRHCELKRGGP